MGCCSLRVEHLKFPSDHEVTLDFLGKDSKRYFQTIDVSRGLSVNYIVAALLLLLLSFSYATPYCNRSTVSPAQLTKWTHVGSLVHSNLRSFCKHKKPEEDVFSELTVRARRVGAADAQALLFVSRRQVSTTAAASPLFAPLILIPRSPRD